MLNPLGDPGTIIAVEMRWRLFGLARRVAVWQGDKYTGPVEYGEASMREMVPCGPKGEDEE